MNAHAHEHTRAHTRMHTHVQLLSEGEQRCAEMAALKDELETVQQRLDDASGPSKTPLPHPQNNYCARYSNTCRPDKTSVGSGANIAAIKSMADDTSGAKRFGTSEISV